MKHPVLDGVHVPQGEGAVSGIFGFAPHSFVRREVYLNVCEKLTVFPYGQDIVGNVVFWLSDDIVRFKIDVGIYEKFVKM